mgnify:FL=1
MVYTRTGEVLLLQRRHPPDFWQSVTGSLKRGESPDSAARRELEEETGLEAGSRLVDCRQKNRFPILPAWRHRYDPEVLYNTESVYRTEYEDRPEIRLNPEEHRSLLWLPRDLAAQQASSHTNQAAILEWVPTAG